MEASQRKFGKFPNAHYVSPMYYQGAYNCKFTFWYNMYHYDRKFFTDVKLNLLYRRNGRDTKLWSRQLTTGDKWKQATVQLPPCPSDFRVSTTSPFLFSNFSSLCTHTGKERKNIVYSRLSMLQVRFLDIYTTDGDLNSVLIISEEAHCTI